MNISQSLISKRDSTLLKGFLMLLIVLGHNSILMQARCIYDYLYNFHVHVFLLLPFLYNIPLFTFKRVKKDFIHIYKPYTIMFLVLVIINIYVLNNKFNLNGTLYAYVSANDFLLKDYVGSSFLWFMPTMFSLLLLRNWLMNKPAKILWSCVIISFAAFLATRVFRYTSAYSHPYIIMGGTKAIIIFSLAVIGRYIFEKYHNTKYFNYISCSVYIATTAICLTFSSGNIYNFITKFLLPISALYTFILIIQQLKDNNIITKSLNYLGKESLPIYLFHVIIYNVILLVIQKAHIAETYLIGTVSYIATLAITIMLIYLCKKSKIYKVMFN